MPLRPQNVKVPRLQDNRHKKVVSYSAPCICRLYPAGDTPGTQFWLSRPQGLRPEWLRQWRISMTPTGMEPAIFRLAANCLNQLRHYQWYKIQDMSGQTEGKLRNVWVRTGDLRDGTWVWRMVSCTTMLKHFTCSQGVRAPVFENHHIQWPVEKRENRAPDTYLCSIHKQTTAQGQLTHIYGLTMDRYNECGHTDLAYFSSFKRKKKKSGIMSSSWRPGVRVFGHPHCNFRISWPTCTELANEGHHNDTLQSVNT